MIPKMIPTRFAHQIDLTAVLKWQEDQAAEIVELEKAKEAARARLAHDPVKVHGTVGDLFPYHKKAQSMSDWMLSSKAPAKEVALGSVPYFTEGEFRNPAQSPKKSAFCWDYGN